MMVFVFGSNLSGHHGEGAAKTAVEFHGAICGVAEGIQGQSYGIPTKAANWKYRLPLSEVRMSVQRFIAYAKANPHLCFHVTRIGCGYAGFRNKQIAPLFVGAPFNCLFDTAWAKYLPEDKQFWGTY